MWHTSATTKAKWWNFELLPELLVWYPGKIIVHHHHNKLQKMVEILMKLHQLHFTIESITINFTSSNKSNIFFSKTIIVEVPGQWQDHDHRRKQYFFLLKDGLRLRQRRRCSSWCWAPQHQESHSNDRWLSSSTQVQTRETVSNLKQ